MPVVQDSSHGTDQSVALSPGLRPLVGLLDVLIEGAVVCDRRGRAVYVNPALARMVGRDRAQLVGRVPPWPFVDDHAQTSLLQSVAAVLGSGNATGTWQGRLRRVDGTTIDHEVLIARIEVPPGERYAVLMAVAPEGAVPVYLDAMRELRQWYDRGERILGSLVGASGKTRRVGVEELLAPGQVLSRREREVLERVLEGLRVSTIARELHISEGTVRNHLKGLFRKFGVNTQASLMERLRSASRT
jgi:PAS domain S-box-containing protein